MVRQIDIRQGDGNEREGRARVERDRGGGEGVSAEVSEWCDSCSLHQYAHPRCDHCKAHATWSIMNLEGPDMDPIVRWLACGRHVHRSLMDGDWELDTVQIMHVEFDGYTHA